IHVILPFFLKLIAVFKFGSLTAGQISELKTLMDLSLPSEFWLAWGSVVSIWQIGRTFEKRGAMNKVVSLITGNK
ncbi:MAG: hypothetical protein JRI34_12910, partial [Deltaproteobacteria bacterium]|nr:hypothetical protein [Deltaproteobacteria bacterium]